MTDTCHECCNVVTRLIEEANEERDILESKFKHYHNYKHVLISIKNYRNMCPSDIQKFNMQTKWFNEIY